MNITEKQMLECCHLAQMGFPRKILVLEVTNAGKTKTSHKECWVSNPNDIIHAMAECIPNMEGYAAIAPIDQDVTP